jgi:hypothetical protein
MGEITLLSSEQERKKVFIQLGNRFKLPKEVVIFLYNVLLTSIKSDFSLIKNFHTNILSARLCFPVSLSIDIDDKMMNPNNPFQYRFPLDRGNEWLIRHESKQRDFQLYNGFYNELKPRDIILHQIKMYGEINFIKEFNIKGNVQFLTILRGKRRFRFIDDHEFNLFDDYFTYNNSNGYNVIAYPDGYQGVWLA